MTTSRTLTLKKPSSQIVFPSRKDLLTMSDDALVSAFERYQAMRNKPATPAAGKLSTHDLIDYTLGFITDELEERGCGDMIVAAPRYLEADETAEMAA